MQAGMALAAACVFSPTLSGASAAPQSAAGSSSQSAPESEDGPERLKQQVRVIVETNVLSAGIATNATHQATSFHWELSWAGWDGLSFDLSQRTRLTNLLADARSKIDGTNAFRVFHLEQLKLNGKIGAKIAVDAAGYSTSKDFRGFDDGVEVRRARLYVKGDSILLLPLSYELEVGYIPNQFYIENSYLALRDIPCRVRVRPRH